MHFKYEFRSKFHWSLFLKAKLHEISNIPAVVQIMAWRRSGAKPLSEPMMASLPTRICITRPQWVKNLGYPNYIQQLCTQSMPCFVAFEYWLILSISFRVTSLALGQSYDCPSVNEAALDDKGKYIIRTTLWQNLILWHDLKWRPAVLFFLL